MLIDIRQKVGNSLGVSEQHRAQFIVGVLAELDHAYTKHGADPWGRHEFAAVLREEVDELWDAIKQDNPIEEVLKEAMQIACVCLRYAETRDRYMGLHPLPLPVRGSAQAQMEQRAHKPMTITELLEHKKVG
jgi:NTP pyrophosphatase (non-canonical NTP hydrolase)